MKEKITKEEVIKKSKELLKKFETTDMTAEEVNNELIEFGKANSKILKGEE
jgi:anaerobic ribonucleoside-triphosphate reductase